MSIAGNLKTMELSELLQWLSMSKKTGTLVVDNSRVQKQIFFEGGRVISSASTDPREHLGSFLVSHGFISEMELSQAMKMQQSNKMLLGKILTTVGAISDEDLHQMLRLKSEEGIFDVFTWPEGEFRFLDGKLPPNYNMVPISLDVAAIVMEGLQRLDEWKRIRETIPSTDYVPVAVAPFDGSDTVDGAPLVLSLVDDDRTVAEIAQTLHANEFHVCRVLARQLAAGRLKVVRPRRVEEALAVAEAPPADAGPTTAEGLVESARQLLDKKELDAALRHARAARALEPDSAKVAAAAQKIEDRLRELIEASGMRLESVPVLAKPMEELTKLKISPQEGFALTGIDGTSDLGSLIKLSPMPALDARLLFWRLLKADLIRLHGRR
jgi:AraC-like DNA-binding protein